MENYKNKILQAILTILVSSVLQSQGIIPQIYYKSVPVPLERLTPNSEGQISTVAKTTFPTKIKQSGVCLQGYKLSFKDGGKYIETCSAAINNVQH